MLVRAADLVLNTEGGRESTLIYGHIGKITAEVGTGLPLPGYTEQN